MALRIDLQSLTSKVNRALGIATITPLSRDVHLIFIARFLRMFAYGSSALVLPLYLSALGYPDYQIGLFMTSTLIGDMLISLALTFTADALGRRRILILGSILMSLSGIVLAVAFDFWVLLAAAVFGIISPGGNEIGPFRAVEESTLAHLTKSADRYDTFAWYVVVGTLGATGGFLMGGWQVQMCQSIGWSEVAAFRTVFITYAIIGAIKTVLTYQLTSRCEIRPTTRPAEESESFLPSETRPNKTNSPSARAGWTIASISPESRAVLIKLCALFFVDSLGSGLVPMSLISFYIEGKFETSAGKLGSIIAVASFLSSMGNIAASSISKRIGLVKTMVFTHLPSAIFLALIPTPSSLSITVLLLVARTSLASMDQAPRSAFLSAIVLPSERTAIMGIVNTLKTASQSVGPLVSGWLAGIHKFWVAFLLAGSLKASYDLGMLYMFVGVRNKENEVKHSEEYELVEDGSDAVNTTTQTESSFGDTSDDDLECNRHDRTTNKLENG